MIQVINNKGAIIKEQINLGNIDNLNIDDLFKNNTSKKMKNNNYPNWLVPLEIAKELKEIGFKENCYFEFSYDNGLTLEANKRDENTIIEIDDLLFCANEVWQNISIPTWEQVFEWFREKGYHGIIAVRYEAGDSEYSYRIEHLNELITDFNQDNPLTYEEARETLIKALIRTYKNEQL